MKVSSKVRLIYMFSFSVIAAFVLLAINYQGAFVWLAFIILPLMILVPFVSTGGFICPKCGGGIYTPQNGVNDMNPYWEVVLMGRCSHCGESI